MSPLSPIFPDELFPYGEGVILLLTQAGIRVASILSSDEADNHFATLADGVVVIVGVLVLCNKRVPAVARAISAIAAGICAILLVMRIAHGVV